MGGISRILLNPSLSKPENDVVCVLCRETSKRMSVNISNTKPGDEREDNLDEEGEEEHGVGVEDGEHHHGEEGDALHQCPAK